MAKKPAQTAANTRRRNDQERKPITLEMVLAICPHARLAENLSTTFGLDPVDTAGIREATEEHVAQAAKALPLSDKALEMHLQRIVGAYVGSAFGAGQFYSQKVTQARDLTAAGSNDSRDEDRDGVSGFESKAERARSFAAQMGLQGPRPRSCRRGSRFRLRPPHRRRLEALREPDPDPHGQPGQRRRPDRRLRVLTHRRGLRSPPLLPPPGRRASHQRRPFRAEGPGNRRDAAQAHRHGHRLPLPPSGCAPQQMGGCRRAVRSAAAP